MILVSYTTIHSGFKGHQNLFLAKRLTIGRKIKNIFRSFLHNNTTCDISIQSCFKIYIYHHSQIFSNKETICSVGSLSTISYPRIFGSKVSTSKSEKSLHQFEEINYFYIKNVMFQRWSTSLLHWTQ